MARDAVLGSLIDRIGEDLPDHVDADAVALRWARKLQPGPVDAAPPQRPAGPAAIDFTRFGRTAEAFDETGQTSPPPDLRPFAAPRGARPAGAPAIDFTRFGRSLAPAGSERLTGAPLIDRPDEARAASRAAPQG
ncbi:MAG: hypothetical protein ABSG76_15400 [Xanthobacteraceae bacterium]|jgi:hypothetical protein